MRFIAEGRSLDQQQQGLKCCGLGHTSEECTESKMDAHMRCQAQRLNLLQRNFYKLFQGDACCQDNDSRHVLLLNDNLMNLTCLAEKLANLAVLMKSLCAETVWSQQQMVRTRPACYIYVLDGDSLWHATDWV